MFGVNILTPCTQEDKFVVICFVLLLALGTSKKGIILLKLVTYLSQLGIYSAYLYY